MLLFLQLFSFTISLYLSCVVVAENENVNNISNQEEEAPLKSSPVIALEIKRLEKISNEINNAQSEESKQLIQKFGSLINKIFFVLKIDVNIK